MAFFLIIFNLLAKEPGLSQQYLVENKDSFVEIPEMKRRKDVCVKSIKDGTFAGNLPDCVIKGTMDGQLPPLSEEEIKKLADKLKTKLGPQFEGKELYQVERRHDEAIKKLGDYYFQRLQDRKSTRLNSSHSAKSRMPSSA